MKQTIVNEVHTEGYLYDYKLETKHSDKNDTDFITGKVSIATDEDCKNVVDFQFVYVTPVYAKSGKANPNHKLLSNIMESGSTKTVIGAGKDVALKISIDGTIGVNDFYSAKDEQVVTYPRNEASFINAVNSLNPDEKKRNTFKTDFFITNTFRKEADEERNVPEHLILKGAIFNSFTKALLPISYTLYHEGAMNYFEGMEISNTTPVFTKVWGSICAQELVTKVETKSAFGEDLVEERTTTRKEYVVTGAQSDCYPWDDAEYLLASEVVKAMADRELHLAEVKKNYDDYQAFKNAAALKPAAPAAAGNFAF